MEVIDVKISREQPKSEVCHFSMQSNNPYLFIKSNLDSPVETFLNFKSDSGKEVKNFLNRNGLNKRISIPDWVRSIYMESAGANSDLSFSIFVEY